MSESYVAGSGYDEYLRANSRLLEANPRSDLLYFETIQHGGGNCLSGITSALGMVGGNLTSKLGSTAQYANTLKAGGGFSMAGGAMFWGGMACSVASGLLGVIGDALAEPVTYEYIPGKIDMKLDAQLDLSGTISSYSSTDQSIYNVTLANIDATNGKDGHFGRGIWSLAEDPVIYLDKDDLLSDYDHFTIMDDPVGSGRYSNSDFGNYGTRYVYFLDPTSVKVNINTDLFPDVEKVYLTTTCGIYPSRETDNDSAYRSFLNLPVPTMSLNPGGETVVRLSNSSTPRIIRAKGADLLLSGADEYETPAMARIKAWQNTIAPFVPNDTKEDMVIEDKPAYWGNHHEYRIMEEGENNFFQVKAEAVRNM